MSVASTSYVGSEGLSYVKRDPQNDSFRNQCWLKIQCRHDNHDSIHHHRCYPGVRLVLCRVLHFIFTFVLLKFHLLFKKALIIFLAWLHVIAHFFWRELAFFCLCMARCSHSYHNLQRWISSPGRSTGKILRPHCGPFFNVVFCCVTTLFALQ